MKKIMFMFVFVILLFTTSFGYTLTIKNGDYTLVREGIMANTTMSFGVPNLFWIVESGNIEPTRIDENNASFVMPTNDVTVEIKGSYTISYNGNGATSGSTASSIHGIDVPGVLTANGFTKTGYVFAGWATTSSGARAYGNQQSVTNLTEIPGETITLYARWVDINGCIIQFLNSNVSFSSTYKTITISKAYKWKVISRSGAKYKVFCTTSIKAWSGYKTNSETNGYAYTFYDEVATALGVDVWNVNTSDFDGALLDYRVSGIYACYGSSGSMKWTPYAGGTDWWGPSNGYGGNTGEGAHHPAGLMEFEEVISGSGTSSSPYQLVLASN